MYFARIENNIVVETLQAEKLPRFHPSLQWVACHAETQEGDLLNDDGSFTTPESILSIEEAKDARKREVTALRENKINKGFTYDGAIYQVNEQAQTDIQSIELQLLKGNTDKFTGFWMDKNNVEHTMTIEEFESFAQAVFDYVLALKSIAWTHKRNIDAQPDVTSVLEYNINTNWP